jgi:hypothetical protein
VAAGLFPETDLSLARATDGELGVAVIYEELGAEWPNSTRLLVARRDPGSGDWRPPERIGATREHAVVGAALEYDGSDRILLVWSEVGRRLAEPRSFPHDASTIDLWYAMFDPSTSGWSNAARLTADNRPGPVADARLR